MKLAERFRKPVLTLIDTPGAYPGIGAEERGQAEAIAASLLEMSSLKTPIVSVVIGEGGSGGALALSVPDRLAMLEHSVYSVISPEGCAAILWRDAAKAPEAAEALRAERERARAARDWARADALRAEIQTLGFAVEDHPGGSRLKPL